jgi:transposase
VTWLLERYGSPAALRKAGRRKLVDAIRPKAPRMAKRLIDDVFDALDEQTVVVPGTGTLDAVIPSLACSLGAVHEQRRAAEAQIRQLLEAHPLSAVLTSIPGVAVRTAATLLVTVGDATSFPTAAHLASYAGLAPTTKSSGTSIHGEHAPRGGNRQLKRAMFLSSFAALHDPASRTYYDKCRARGKTHTGTSPLGPTTHQRAVRDAPRRHLLRTPNPRSEPRMTNLGLTKDIEAPPVSTYSPMWPGRYV